MMTPLIIFFYSSFEEAIDEMQLFFNNIDLDTFSCS